MVRWNPHLQTLHQEYILLSTQIFKEKKTQQFKNFIQTWPVKCYKVKNQQKSINIARVIYTKRIVALSKEWHTYVCSGKRMASFILYSITYHALIIRESERGKCGAYLKDIYLIHLWSWTSKQTLDQNMWNVYSLADTTLLLLRFKTM